MGRGQHDRSQQRLPTVEGSQTAATPAAHITRAAQFNAAAPLRSIQREQDISNSLKSRKRRVEGSPLVKDPSANAGNNSDDATNRMASSTVYSINDAPFSSRLSCLIRFTTTHSLLLACSNSLTPLCRETNSYTLI